MIWYLTWSKQKHPQKPGTPNANQKERLNERKAWSQSRTESGSRISYQLFILGLHWLDVKTSISSPRLINTHLRLRIEQPGVRRINKYISTILHCNAPDFKYVRFLWRWEPRRSKVIMILWFFFFSHFHKYINFREPTVIVIALFLHILGDAGLRSPLTQRLESSFYMERKKYCSAPRGTPNLSHRHLKQTTTGASLQYVSGQWWWWSR